MSSGSYMKAYGDHSDVWRGNLGYVVEGCTPARCLRNELLTGDVRDDNDG